MKETGQSPSFHDSPFIPCHHTVFGGSALETLPEEEGDNEEGYFRTESQSPSQYVSWSRNEVEERKSHPFLGEERTDVTKNGNEVGTERTMGSDRLPTIRNEIENQRAKVHLLEATIRQLKDELRESKDQNELLEFRLLELGELESSSTSATTQEDSEDEVGKRCNRRRSNSDEVDGLDLGSGVSEVPSLYEEEGTEASSEVMNTEERTSNGHASVTEARSSCSDCSESLSFQESGIFEAQFSEDPYAPSTTGRRNREDIGLELGSLVSQIEALVERFRREEGTTGRTDGDKGTNQSGKSGKGSSRSRTDLSYEFLICRQRIQEFERKIRKLGNVDYVQSLEEKISLLMQESQRLEEEKAEMEEAENDSRNLCQRLEEKLKNLKGDRMILEQQLSHERTFVEELRMEIIDLQEKEKFLISQMGRLESTVQAQEQQNFDLEESYIELKDSIQFLMLSIPVLLAWVLWTVRRRRVVPLPLAIPPPTLREEKRNSLPEGKMTKDSMKRIEVGTQTKPESKLLEKSQKDSWRPAEKELEEKIQPFVLEETGLGKEVRERDSALENSEQKLITFQEQWDSLIKELEDFEVECRKHPNEPFMSSRNNVGQGNPSKQRQGTLVANRIRSLFPDDSNSVQKAEIPPIVPKTSQINTHQFRQKLITYLRKYDERERVLQNELDRLKRDSAKERLDYGTKEIDHLKMENNRLERLLQEQESVWMRVQELEDDNAKLRLELIPALGFERRIEEAQATVKEMMNRVEESEQNERSWKDAISRWERKDKELQEKLSHHRSELQILSNKCTLLEDELEVQKKAETSYREEIQNLRSQLKESESVIQDKENILSGSEASFLSQISTLERQVAEAQEELGDLECSNGMLREEVLYFERALAEVSERGEKNERLAQILTSKLQEREDRITDLKKQVAEAGIHRFLPSSNNNDLDVFARNDGGLIGVGRNVKEALTLLSSCGLCKLSAGRILVDVSEQLNTLTLMLEGSHDVSGESQQMNLPLSRCESEELLSSSSTVLPSLSTKWVSSASVGNPACRCQVAENKMYPPNLSYLTDELLKKEEEIRRLNEKERILHSQLKGMEEIMTRREKDLRESHINESWWWKLRCDEKNELIQILARRIAHLSATDFHGGSVLEGILLPKHGGNYPTLSADRESPDTTSLLNYFQLERRRMMDILQNSSVPIESHPNPRVAGSTDFRVLRRIGDDALLVSWSVNSSEVSNEDFDGYEVFVNGESYLRVPNPMRCKAILFGLNITEPLQLSLRQKSRAHEISQQVSSITYIA